MKRLTLKVLAQPQIHNIDDPISLDEIRYAKAQREIGRIICGDKITESLETFIMASRQDDFELHCNQVQNLKLAYMQRDKLIRNNPELKKFNL